ncbi:MAG: hypothetical protein JSR67_15175 [Proteobacteria bacterium]|nr:hypothetical protein [Pseudomonadota bacterium]
MNFLDTLCAWLGATTASQTIKTAEWIIPAVQLVHILAVASVMTSVLMIDLRLLGLRARELTVASTVNRFLPNLWGSLPVLLVTGATLITAEPARTLRNPTFFLKMALLLAAVAVTLTCQLPLRRDATFWERSAGRRRAIRLAAIVSLALWISIVFAGRWIAYTRGA